MGSSEPNRRSYLSLAAIGFLGAFAFSAVEPVLPLYVESLDVSYEKIGGLFSAYSLTWTALQEYTGHLADRFGRKRLALVGFAIYAAFAGLNYVARDFTQLLLFRILQGVGLGLLGPAILGLTAAFEAKEKSYASFSIAIPLAGKGVGLSPSQIGIVLSSYALSFTLLQVPVAMVAAKAGKRRLLVAASLLSALLFLGLYAARGLLPLVLLMALLGITLGAIFVQSTALAAEVVAEEASATGLAFFDALIDLSFTVMPLVVGLTTGFGGSVPFLACALFFGGAGILFRLSPSNYRQKGVCTQEP